MPYKVRKQGSKWCVFNSDTDDNKGCSDTKSKAEAHMRALYAAEDKSLDVSVAAEAALEFEVQLKELSLSDRERKLYTAFQAQFAKKEPGDYWSWSPYSIDKCYDAYAVVFDWDDPNANLYKVTYKENGEGGYEFAAREDWVRVEYDVVEKALPVAEPAYVEQKEFLTLKERFQKLWEKVFPKATPRTGFYTIKQADGSFRWVGISSTAFLDRENEIIPVEALENIKSVEEGDLGPLQYWHLPIELGTTDTRIADGVCLVESGLWSDDPVAKAIREDSEANPDNCAMSIGFYADAEPLENVEIKGKVVRRIWPRIKQKERSLLPKQFAANEYTFFITEGGTPVDDTKRKALTDILGEDMAATVIAQVDSLNQKAQEKDAVVKETDLPPVEDTPAEDTPAPEATPETKEDNSISQEELTKALTALQGLPEQIAALRKEIDDLKAKEAPRIAELFQASKEPETQATEEETKEAGPLKPTVVDDIANKMLGIA